MVRIVLALALALALTSLAVSSGTHKPRCNGHSVRPRPLKKTIGYCSGQYKGFPRYPPRKIVKFVHRYFKTLSDCDIPAHTSLLARDFQSFEADGDVLTVERQRGALRGFCQAYNDAKFEPIRITYVSPRVVYMVVRLSSKAFKNDGFTYSHSMTLVPCGKSYVLGQDVQTLSSARLQQEAKVDEMGV